MMSEILTRAAAPLLVGLLWLAAAVFIFRPADGPGGAFAAGLLGGLALTISALAPLASAPRRRGRDGAGRAIMLCGFVLLLAAAVAAPAAAPGAAVRILSTPSGLPSPAGVIQAAIESGLALVMAGLIGVAVTRLTARRHGP